MKDTEAEEKAAQQNLHIWLSDMFTADDQSVRILMWTGTNKVGKQRNNKHIWPILLTVLLGKHCWHVQVRSQKQGGFCEIT